MKNKCIRYNITNIIKINFLIISTLMLLFNTSLIAKQNSLNLTSEEKEYLRENPIIRYTPDPSWLPYEAFDKNGNHIGIISDILKLIEKKIDVKFDIVTNSSWDEALKMANSNEIDMITSDPSDTLLQNKFKAIDTYLTNPIVIIMKKDNPYVSNLNYLKDKKIVVVKGYGYVPELKLAYPEIKFKYEKNLQDALMTISKGKNDILLASVASASYNMFELGLSNLAIVGKTDINMKVAFFIKKENELLFNIINKVTSIKTTPNGSVMNEIMKKWTIQEYVEKIDYNLIFKIVIIFILIILVGLVWTRQMARSKEKISELNLKLEEKIEELEQLSITDAMTGLHNRRHFDKIFKQELQRCQRNKRTLVFSMLDVDKFKQYNDTYGHDMGDEVLINIANTMKSFTKRANDFVFRVGGEEFCLITSEINEDEAYKYINDLRVKIEQSHIEHIHNSASKYVTASFGLVIVKFEENIDINVKEIYKIADNALYEAKETGRNKIERVIIK